jgi:hypothetical protein
MTDHLECGCHAQEGRATGNMVTRVGWTGKLRPGWLPERSRQGAKDRHDRGGSSDTRVLEW